MPAFPPHGVFISYRREDGAPYACLLQFKLRERFPDVPVFVDLDSIEAGADFVEAIKSGVDSCVTLVALIGPRWLTIADQDGRRRLDDPDDYVRYEIRTALDRGVRVIPALIDGAKAPRHQDLPPDLQKLARLNAVEISCARFDYDATKLMDAIQRELEVWHKNSAAKAPPALGRSQQAGRTFVTMAHKIHRWQFDPSRIRDGPTRYFKGTNESCE